jgi:PhnB protein
MHGPDGADYKNKSVFKEVHKNQKLVYEHVSGPKFIATIQFESRGDKTFIQWQMLFKTREEFIQTVKTFKADEGLRQNVIKLNAYVEAKFKLRNQNNPKPMARVCTYLNFNGNTEEAFKFYQSVFKGEFVGKGLERFGDLPPQDGMPPLSDSVKKLILHAELQILGGHVLMATDAPESMGFKLNTGNNMHINVEPASREETKRIFDALSSGGKVDMELKDMFFGAYFGSCTDKYGINWMLNFPTK